MTHRVVALRTVSKLLKRGISPSYHEDGVLVINQRCIRDGRVSLAAARRNDLQRRGVPDDRWLRRWDVVVNSTGVGTLGRVAQLTGTPPEPMTADSHVTIVRPDLDQVDGRYFGYALRKSQQQIEAMGEGATGQTELSRHRLGEEVIIGLPPLSVQRKIAAVLAAYDELVENNLRRIEILEEMAQAVYREWFVNFGFPGHEDVGLVHSPLGPIPDGWEVVRLGAVTDINSETIRPKDAPAEIRYIDISSVSPGSIDAVTWMPFDDAPSRARRVVRHGDTIWSTVRPNRRSFALVLNPAENTIASTGFAVLRPINIPWVFLHLATSTMEFSAYLANHARGAAYPAVNAEDFEKARVVIPSAELVGQFAPLVEPMFELRENLRHQNANLRLTRDLLLPKLVSGEMDASELDIDTEWLAS